MQAIFLSAYSLYADKNYPHIHYMWINNYPHIHYMGIKNHPHIHYVRIKPNICNAKNVSFKEDFHEKICLFINIVR